MFECLDRHQISKHFNSKGENTMNRKTGFIKGSSKNVFFLFLLVLLLVPVRSFGQTQISLSNPFSSGVPKGQGTFGFSGGGFVPNTLGNSPAQEGPSWKEQAVPSWPTGAPQQMGMPGPTVALGQMSVLWQTETPEMGQAGALSTQRDGGWPTGPTGQSSLLGE
jgi:hypothetical protein